MKVLIIMEIKNKEWSILDENHNDATTIDLTLLIQMEVITGGC